MPSHNRILEGKLAIITGAARGIGAAIAENLAGKGANLVLNYTSDSSASITADLAKRLESEHGIKTLPVKANLGTTDEPQLLVDKTKEHFSAAGKFQIDIIINNAGVNENISVAETTLKSFDFQYHVNVRGPLLLMKAAEPYLPHDRSGRIVNVSSVSATAGLPTQSIYGGTKAALEAMTRSWAAEFSERAVVNAVNPGPVATDMWDAVDDDFLRFASSYVAVTPLARVREGIDPPKFMEQAEILRGRPAYPAEVAGTVAMLCTPDAAYTTGSTVCANGGMVQTKG